MVQRRCAWGATCKATLSQLSPMQFKRQAGKKKQNISDTWLCDLWYVNYKFLITVTVENHWGFYCKVSLGKPFVVSTCRRRNGFNLSHGISLVLDSDQSERLIMAEQRVWYSRNFLWLREVGCKELNTCSLISYFSGNERWKSGASGMVL